MPQVRQDDLYGMIFDPKETQAAPIAVMSPVLDATGRSAATSDWIAALKVAAYAFVLSRMLIFLAFALSFSYAEHRADPLKPTETLRAFTPAFFGRMVEIARSGDVGWYLNIAEHGYERRPFDTRAQANWAFFPLHPKLWRGLMHLGIPPLLGGVLMANVLFLLALMQTWRWVRRVGDEETATRAVLCIAFWPTSYFFSLPFTESLFLFLLSSSLLAMHSGRWFWAALLAGLCSGTRVVGVLLSPMLWWQARPNVSLLRRTCLALLATSGLVVFMWMLWKKTGDPLAFAHIQTTWGRESGNFLAPLRHWLDDPLVFAEPWNAQWLNLFSVAFGLCAAVWLWRRGAAAWALFVLACVLLPWQSGTLTSMGRYLSTSAPAFFGLACWLRRPEWLLAWLLGSSAMLVAMSAAFLMGESFPMT